MLKTSLTFVVCTAFKIADDLLNQKFLYDLLINLELLRVTLKKKLLIKLNNIFM